MLVVYYVVKTVFLFYKFMAIIYVILSLRIPINKKWEINTVLPLYFQLWTYFIMNKPKYSIDYSIMSYINSDAFFNFLYLFYCCRYNMTVWPTYLILLLNLFTAGNLGFGQFSVDCQEPVYSQAVCLSTTKGLYLANRCAIVERQEPAYRLTTI